MPMEMPTIESIKRFVQMGMGVAIVPRMCVTGKSSRLDEGSENPATKIPRHLYMISRRGARLPHAAAEFLRLLKTE